LLFRRFPARNGESGQLALTGVSHTTVSKPALQRNPQPDGQISKNLSSPFCKNILIFRRPKSPV
jgi:hypothetical protein